MRWLREIARSKIRGEVSTSRLVRLGLVVRRDFRRMEGFIIDYSHCWLISIGNDVTFAPRVHILAHDASTKRALGYTRIGRVAIGDRVFVGAGAIVLPGVTIGDDAVVAAGSVVTRSVAPGDIVGGSPARVLGATADMLERNRLEMARRPVFGSEWTVGRVSDSNKREMRDQLLDGIGFVE